MLQNYLQTCLTTFKRPIIGSDRMNSIDFRSNRKFSLVNSIKKLQKYKISKFLTMVVIPQATDRSHTDSKAKLKYYSRTLVPSTWFPKGPCQRANSRFNIFNSINSEFLIEFLLRVHWSKSKNDHNPVWQSGQNWTVGYYMHIISYKILILFNDHYICMC